jgi:hypothetical protein
VQDNVFYQILGHAVFIEDAVERKNLIERNLVVEVAASFSLLQTDQRPAAFYVTHPDNMLNANVAVNATGSGFWYHL